MALGKLIKKRPLQMGAAELSIFGFDLLADRRFQRIERFHPERFRKFFIDSDRCRLLDFLNGDIERHLFALEFLIRMIVRHIHLDHLLIAALGADNLLLKAGNKSSLTQLELKVIHLAAGKGFSVNGAGKVENNLVALLCSPAVGHRGKLLAVLRQTP